MQLLLFILKIDYKPVVCLNPELDLLNHLMRNYSPIVRPVLDPQQPLIANLSIEIAFIIDLDEKEQVRVNSPHF